MSVELNSVIGMEASEVGPGITKANERQIRWYSTRAQAVSAASSETWTVGAQIAVGPCVWEYDGTSTAISDMTGWVPVWPVKPTHFNDLTDAINYSLDALNYGPSLVDGDNPNSYYNIYGYQKYRTASYERIQVGSESDAKDDPRPIIAIHKESSASRDVDTSAWDQCAYFSLISRSGSAYRAAVTGFARAMDGCDGDHIGVHGRADVRSVDTRGYGVWAYGADLVGSGNAAACHAIEANGQSLSDPGYNSDHQLIRLCMADNSSDSNRFGSAITIGRPTSGTNNGFHCGIWIQNTSIIGSASTNGEAIRIDARPNTDYGNTGGIRFAKQNTTDTGVFKYGIRTDEASFVNDVAISLGLGHRISFGTYGVGTNPEIAGGSNNVSLLHGFVNVVNPVGDTAIQVSGVKILGVRKTGWSTPTGTATRSTFATTTVTTEQLAQRVKALIDDLTAHGLIGA